MENLSDCDEMSQSNKFRMTSNFNKTNASIATMESSLESTKNSRTKLPKLKLAPCNPYKKHKMKANLEKQQKMRHYASMQILSPFEQNNSSRSSESNEDPYYKIPQKSNDYFRYMPVKQKGSSRNMSMFSLEKTKPYGPVKIFNSIQNPEYQSKTKLFLRYKKEREPLLNSSQMSMSKGKLKPLKR